MASCYPTNMSLRCEYHTRNQASPIWLDYCPFSRMIIHPIKYLDNGRYPPPKSRRSNLLPMPNSSLGTHKIVGFIAH